MKQYNYFTWLIPHFTWLGIYLKLLIPHRKLIRVNNICCEAQGPCGRSGSPSSGPKAWARFLPKRKNPLTGSLIQWFSRRTPGSTCPLAKKPNRTRVRSTVG